MDTFQALFNQHGSEFEISSPTARANDCEYEFRSDYKLSDLSDFHGAIPDFQAVSGSDGVYRCDAVPAIRFVTEANADLLDAAYAALPDEIKQKIARVDIGQQLPEMLAPSKDSLLRNLTEQFGLADLMSIKDEKARSVLAKFIVECLTLHVTSREILLKSEAPLATMRLMEGSRIGDVVQSRVHGQPCMAVIVDIEQDYNSSGPYVNISTAVLGAALGRHASGLAWQVWNNVLPMRRRTRAAGICLPATSEQLQAASADSQSKAQLLGRAIAAPLCAQLKEPAVFTQKRPRQSEAEVPVSGRVILDHKGFMLNVSSHGQDFSFYEVNDEFFESITVEDAATHLSEYAACLSPSIPAYSLRLRKWGFVPFAMCEDVEYREGLMDKLVVEESVKGLLLALTNSFTQKSDERQTDFVVGKSGGNVFLLHGPSGIGKTLTAEATAESLKRPLYRVAAADLGTTAPEININLERVLDNSKRWGAVTLLDEADIFLEARSSDNIERNAIVGIFLQTLEYSSGVLFVTTNRINNLDQAILPRISLGFSYPALTTSAREVVWRNILGLHQHKVGDKDIATLAEYPFNGRQIKNVVNLAATTAASGGVPLSFEQLKLMADATKGFIMSCSTDKPAMNDAKRLNAA